jgi:choline dehydrogenase-like flavoprotein
LGIPKPEITYSIDEYVMKSVQDTREQFDRMLHILRATDVEHEPQLMGNNHVMGTMIMGDDPRRSVVDKNCRSFDHANLFVAGSAVFPSSAAVNPTLTLAALSLNVAEVIKAELSLGNE